MARTPPILLATLLAAIAILGSSSLTVNQLHSKYYTIFSRHRDRNAASHLWASYVLDRAPSLTEKEIYKLMGAFCPVSGSIVRPSSYNLYSGVQIKRATNPSENISAGIHVCCWPCICDLQALVHTDTKTISTKDGTRRFDALVIGNPCINPSKIPSRAPEVYCKKGELAGATKSDNGYIIIGMAQSASAIAAHRGGKQAASIKGRCEYRASQGFQSGMGKIFIEVASINRISEAPNTHKDLDKWMSGEVKPCHGDDRGDFRCNWDYTHRVCAKLVENSRGECKKLKWGAEDFWTITRQQRFEWSKLICSTKKRRGGSKPPFGSNWCICMWATERLIKKVGCDNVHLDCAATDVNWVLNRYNDRDFLGKDYEGLEKAKCCLIKKCPQYINNDTKTKINYDTLKRTC